MKGNSTSLPELRMDVLNQYSLIYETAGYSPIAGQIFSLLLFAAQPLSLQDMCDQLKVSKAAVSVQVRTLLRIGICSKIPTSRDRRDYYRISEEMCSVVIRHELDKAQKIHTLFYTTLLSLEAISQLESMEVESYTAFKHRVEDLSLCYSLLVQKIGELQEEWVGRDL
jgi:DNA-binding transcriptional regulator GbsR (MarR family)